MLSNCTRKGVFSEPTVMAGEPRSINDFPEEIMLKILSYVGPEDLSLIIAEVCERWNALAKDMILWKTLSYSCDRTSDLDRVVQVLTVAPGLHSLNIRDRNDTVHILKILFDSHIDIRKLILKYCDLGKDGTDILTNIVTLYPDLEALSLEGCYPLKSAAYCLIPRLNKLSELNLSECQGLSGKTVRLIADTCQHLKKLSLEGVYHVVGDDIVYVILKLGQQLTTLVLHGRGLTDAAYSYLNKCARLQELKVPYCREMTDTGLLDGIGSLQELTSLCLTWGFNLTAQALSTFLNQPSMTSLVSLDLSRCRSLDDEGLKGIARRCKHLKELAVCWCPNVTDAGISMVISHCNQLHVLNLMGLMHITGNGYLPLVPSHLPHLRLLSLEKCKSVCDEYAEELLAAVPELVVINRSGDIVGGMSNNLQDKIHNLSTEYAYVFIRQWALDI